MSAHWHPCVCGHRKDAHDLLKDGGACNHENCDCHRFRRPSWQKTVAAPRHKARGNPGTANTRD